MRLKFHVVLWDDGPETFLGFFNFHKFENFRVVFGHFRCQGVWTDVDDVHVGIFKIKYPGYLRIFLLLIVINTPAFIFSDWIRIDMDFQTFLLLDLWPTPFKLILHLSPDPHRLVFKPSHFNFSRFFQLVKSILSLNDSCLLHQEFQLIESWECFMSSPNCLDFDCS